MKKFFSFLLKLIPHAVLVLSLALLTFFVIDLCNEAMAFLDNRLTKWTLAADALLSVILAVSTIVKKD